MKRLHRLPSGIVRSELIASVGRASLLSPVYSALRATPLREAPRLSKALGCTVLLKRDDLLPTFSSSVRGAVGFIARLSAVELAKGLVTVENGTGFGQREWRGRPARRARLPPR